MSHECEITGNRDDCDGDRSGVNSMPYKDYCVTMLDKVQGIFRTDPEMPVRHVDRDAMTFAYRDDDDPVTAAHPGIPERLELWEEVTRPGRYYDPAERGFWPVEIYDPEYWMAEKGMTGRDCFHPIYRMRARNTLSPLDDCTVALWVTAYEHIVPQVAAGAGVAAPSVHFGMSLWFFDRAQVDNIVAVVFDEWQIGAP
jgi:hypothetical protein